MIENITTNRDRALLKAARLEHANAAILEISKYGRRFFHHEGRVSRFTLAASGHLFYIDKYRGSRLHVDHLGSWKFSDGGTLRALVEDLRDYIRTGQPINSWCLGPWPKWICRGDMWGYGADMQKLRDALADSPTVDWSKPCPYVESFDQLLTSEGLLSD